MGAQFLEVEGSYGQRENSLVVVGITEDQAKDLGRKYDQDSVLTRSGLIYQDGSRNPATGVEVFRERPEDFYSVIGGTIYRINIDFDQKLPAQKPPADLVKIFDDLRGPTKARRAAKAAAEAHPLSARIQEIETNFLDILEELEDKGALRINCD